MSGTISPSSTSTDPARAATQPRSRAVDDLRMTNTENANGEALWRQRCWRDGELLVVPTVARLDHCCFQCGERPSRSYLQELHWHARGWFLLVALSPLVYFVVALVVRQTVTLHVGLCSVHARSRRRLRLGGLGMIALAIGLVVLAIKVESGALGGLAAVTLMAGAIVSVVAGQLVRLHAVQGGRAWIANGSERLREGLPEFAG